MTNTTKWVIGIVVVLVVIIGLVQANKKDSSQTTGSGGTTTKVESSGPIKVGVILPLTGDAAAYGEPMRNALTLAADDVNKNGGVGGKDIVLIYEDGKCSGKDAASAASKLVSIDKVQVIIGGFCSSESLAALPVVETAKVALFSGGSSSPDLTGKSRFFFRDYPSDASQGKVLAELAWKRGLKKVAFIQEQLDYPLGIYKAFSTRFLELGGALVKEEFPSNATDFRSALTKLRSQNPDALFIDTQTGAGAERILKQLTDLQWKPQLFLTDATAADTKTMEANKVQLEGAIAAEFGTDPTSPQFMHLADSYKAKYGAEMPYASYTQTVYDAVFIVRDAVKAVGYDGSKIADWARTVKDWPGASGKVTIGADGDRIGGHIPKIVKSGKTEPVTE